MEWCRTEMFTQYDANWKLISVGCHLAKVNFWVLKFAMWNIVVVSVLSKASDCIVPCSYQLIIYVVHLVCHVQWFLEYMNLIYVEEVRKFVSISEVALFLCLGVCTWRLLNQLWLFDFQSFESHNYDTGLMRWRDHVDSFLHFSMSVLSFQVVT